MNVFPIRIYDENNKNKKGLIGLIGGTFNGLFGGGGGMVVVPCLKKYCNLTEKESHATALLIILPMTIISGAIYFSYEEIKLSLFLPIAIGNTLGGILGALLLKKLSSFFVKMIFYIIMLYAGIRMLFF